MKETLDELGRHLSAALAQTPEARVFAFHDERVRALPEALEADGVRWRVVAANSELAIRAALVDQPQDLLLAIITKLETRQLSRDIRARICKHKLLNFDRWESLKPRFQATSIDARLRRNDALGRALLRCSTSSGFRPAQTGILQVDEAWNAYFTHALGMSAEPFGADQWAAWLIEHPADAAGLFSDDELFEHVAERARARCGAVVSHVFWATRGAIADEVEIGTRLHALAYAIGAALAASDAGEQASTATRFFVRLENYFGKQELSRADLSRFAAEILRTDLAPDAAAALDALLAAEHAESLSVFSDISARGYRARRERFAGACDAMLDTGADGAAVVAALGALESHVRFAGEDAAHQERLRALARLTLRLPVMVNTPHAESVSELARAYVDDGSFVDALREQLEQGDLGTDLAATARRVLERAAVQATVANQRFAAAVAQHLRASHLLDGAFFVHDMMRTVLAPLAAERDVLLLVLDGLSWFVLRQITGDSQFERWLALAPSHEETHLPMLATVPSITRFSRTSLLTGKLQTGDQGVERKGFATEPNLVNAIGNKRRAVLLHRAQLDADGRGAVGHAVVEAVRDPKNRVVGVVLNAVDDQLAGAAQLAFTWRVDTLAPLRSLLELAEASGRDVLVVSDHGHIWDGGTAAEVKATAARYREPTVPAAAGELLVEGPMVEASQQGAKLVVAVAESVRYTGGKRGYHGGLSLQELVAPCLLLTAKDNPDPSRWSTLSIAPPAWWSFRESEHQIRTVPKAVAAPNATAPSDQLSLIDPTPAPGLPRELPEWLPRFLDSQVLKQKLAASPVSVSSEHLAVVLATLHANKDRAYVATLAEAISTSATRFARSIPTLQRVLNVEGFTVLDFDRGENMLRLDRAMLMRQFHLE